MSKAEVVTDHFPSTPSLPLRLPLLDDLKSQLSWPDSVCSSPWSSVFQLVPCSQGLIQPCTSYIWIVLLKSIRNNLNFFKLDKCLSHYLMGTHKMRWKAGWWGSLLQGPIVTECHPGWARSRTLLGSHSWHREVRGQVRPSDHLGTAPGELSLSRMEILCSMELNCNSLCWVSLQNQFESNTEFLLKTKKGSCEQILLFKALDCLSVGQHVRDWCFQKGVRKGI